MIGQIRANSTSGKAKSFKRCERALFTSCIHCSAHLLNFVLVKSCAIPETESTFDNMGMWLVYFLNRAVKEMHD